MFNKLSKKNIYYFVIKFNYFLLLKIINSNNKSNLNQEIWFKFKKFDLNKKNHDFFQPWNLIW